MQFWSVRSGVLSAIAILVVLAVAIIFIAPQIDLEDGVLGAEQILYALLMALASIIALSVVRAQGPAIAPLPLPAFGALARPSPSIVSCRLLC